MDNFQFTLSQAITNYNGNTPGRASNIELAAKKINGCILLPGEEFSCWDMVSPVTAEAGYQPATVFEKGKRTVGIGGGVCQVSSTIYNAQLKSGIPSKERHPHSHSVAYIPLGLDAAVASKSMDYRFQNTLPVPIKILVAAAGGTLLVEFKTETDINEGYSYEPFTFQAGKFENLEIWNTRLRTYFHDTFIEESSLHYGVYIVD